MNWTWQPPTRGQRRRGAAISVAAWIVMLAAVAIRIWIAL